MTSPAKRVPREKKSSLRRLTGTATTCAPRKAAPTRSSASCSVVTGGPPGSQTSTGTPARSRSSSGTVGPTGEEAGVAVEHGVEQAQQLGGGGGVAQDHDLHAVPFLVVDGLHAQRARGVVVAVRGGE